MKYASQKHFFSTSEKNSLGQSTDSKRYISGPWKVTWNIIGFFAIEPPTAGDQRLHFCKRWTHPRAQPQFQKRANTFAYHGPTTKKTKQKNIINVYYAQASVKLLLFSPGTSSTIILISWCNHTTTKRVAAALIVLWPILVKDSVFKMSKEKRREAARSQTPHDHPYKTVNYASRFNFKLPSKPQEPRRAPVASHHPLYL